MTSQKQQNPYLFNALVRVNIFAFCLLILVGVSITFIIEDLDSKVFLEARKREVVPQIESMQEKWIAWKALGYDDVLAKDLVKTAEKWRLEKLTLVSAYTLQTRQNDPFFFTGELPEELRYLPWRVEAKIGKSQKSQMFGSYIYLALFFVFTFGVFFSVTWLIRTRVFLPLEEFLLERNFHNPKKVSGEVLEILDLFADMCKKIRESERSIAVARTTQMLAHDVRAPFEMINVMLKTLLLQINQGKDLRILVEKCALHVESQIKRVSALVDDVLELGCSSRPLGAEISLGAVIKDCLNELSSIYPSLEVDIELDLRHQVLIRSNGQSLFRLFQNIIKNAFEAMNYVGILTISSTMNGSDWVLVEIKNSGSSIPPEIAQHLFDSFNTFGKHNGVGLGLAISKKIVEEHGGYIYCLSDEETKETRFVFSLPSAEAKDNTLSIKTQAARYCLLES